MKYLLAMIIVISTFGLLVGPGLSSDISELFPAGDPMWTGPGGRIQHVTGKFVHDTSTDVFWRQVNPGLGLTCFISGNPHVDITGDIVGGTSLLSDVYCLNADFTSARVEVVVVLIGTLAKSGAPINMTGRMTLDIDLTVYPAKMTGYQVFQNGIGTHYGAFFIEGAVRSNPDPAKKDYFLGEGTYTGWVRENKAGKSH